MFKGKSSWKGGEGRGRGRGRGGEGEGRGRGGERGDVGEGGILRVPFATPSLASSSSSKSINLSRKYLMIKYFRN